MKSNLFRKEAVDKITSPDDLNIYVKTITPRVWLILAGVIIALAGVIIFVTYTDIPLWDLFFGSTVN